MIAFFQKLLRKFQISVDFSNKLTSDILWNFVSFSVIAVCGIALNILIVSIYGSSALGLFNQIYAIFIILSQLAVNGIHFSVLRSTSLCVDQRELSKIFTSALALVIFVSIVLVGLAFPLINQASAIFKSDYLTSGVKLVLPGLVFFSLNKVILAFLNGQRRMKTFAIFQGMRSIFLLTFLLLHAWLIHDSNSISIIFTLSEGLLLLCLFPLVYQNVTIHFNKSFIRSVVTHFRFGLKATGGNILMELNTKIDILLLGLFVSDSEVGIYSFAALFIEGFLQLPTIIRNNINPILASKYNNNKQGEFVTFLKSVIRNSYMIFVPLGVLGILAFPLTGLIKSDLNIQITWLYFVIMIAGVILASGFLPLLMTFNQAGKPGLQSLVLLSTTIVMVISILIFTRLFGTLGTAIGVGLTYIIQAGIIGGTLKKISSTTE